MIDTRSIARRDLQFDDEHSTGVAMPARGQGDAPDLAQPLQQQIQQKDDHILQFEK